jgi:HK97 family phage prohead protease
VDAHNNTRPTYDGFLTKDQQPLPAKANAEQGILSGYGSKFWTVDSYAEATAPGSFQKTISERGPDGVDRIFLRYEHYETCGVWTSLKEDGQGLFGEAFVKDDGNFGSRLRNHLSEPHPIPYGLSIGFRRMAQRPATEDDPLDLSSAPGWVKQLAAQDIGQITVLTEVKLMEISAVTFPAVDPAMVESYRTDIHEIALQRVLTDLKADRLTDAHLATLTRITQAMPADRTPEHGRDVRSTTPPSDSTPPAIRNYRAELLLAELGVSF